MNERIRRPRRRANRSAGFSLIEVLMALIVFAIGVLGLAMVIPAGTNRVGKAGQQTRASQLAAMRAEQLLTTPYDDSDLDAGDHNDASNPLESRYYVQWTVETDQPITACKRVTVKVRRNSITQPIEAQVVIVVPQSGGV
jgi:type IV pilus modification protein PilV